MTAATKPAPIAQAAVSAADRYLFDLQGFLLLRGALTANECENLLATVSRLEAVDYEDSWRNRINPAYREHSLPTKCVHAGSTAIHGPSTRLNGLLRLDSAFDRLIDHPRTLPYVREFMDDPQVINTWSISKRIGTEIGGWHRGHMPMEYFCREGVIRSTMLNVVYFLTDNGPDDGCMAAVPGSHKSDLALLGAYGKFPVLPGGADFPYPDYQGLDLPGSVAITGKAGDVLIFSESLIHNGLRKTTDGTRTNLYFNHLERRRSVAGYEPHNMRHFWLPDRTRERFNADQRQLTRWMDNARYELDE